MPKFLWKASYTQAGVKGVAAAGGTSRREVVQELAASVGGSVDAFYFAFGEADLYVIADLPDNEAAVAVALTVGATGAVTLETVPLITPEEVDAAAKREVTYQPAGG
jgi:uncharacterized protein with GYD domain